MSLKALVYAYILGGLTFLPLAVLALVFYTVYTSVPIGDPDIHKHTRAALERKSAQSDNEDEEEASAAAALAGEVNDQPRTRKGWLTMRRTFEESTADASYVTLVRGFLDARSKDPRRARPKDMWYVVLKGTVLYLYEDEACTECEAALDLAAHDVVVFPEGQQDGEMFAKRNAICLKPRVPPPDGEMPSVTKEMKLADDGPSIEEKVEEKGGSTKKREMERERLENAASKREAAREEALNVGTPWFIFVRSNFEMEDWYLALIHASDNPANTPTLSPLARVFQLADMAHLVETLDAQPDVIPTRWLNALIGRIFFSHYRTQVLEDYIIGRLMKKLSKVKRPQFLADVVVKEVSVGNRPPTLSKPMLKELTKEGDASVEVHMHYKGEFRVTVEATAIINLGARFKPYTVKLVLAAVLREIEGNLLIKVKRPPSSRIWYAFTAMPKMVLDVEPIVSDRQITWGMITSQIESRLKEIILESVVLPNMDDIAFFDSQPYERRGGIWPEAARTSTSGSSESQPESPVGNGLPTGSAPEPDAPTLDRPATVDERSTAPKIDESTTLARSSSAPPEAGIVLSAPPDQPSTTKTSTATKRQTWMANSTSALSESKPDLDTQIERGRSMDPDASSPRSHSTPGHTRLNGDATSVRSETSDRFLSPHRPVRSVSRDSTASTESKDSAATPGSGSPSLLSTSVPNTPHMRRTSSASHSDATGGSSSGSTSTTATGAQGFLSTLKSRAAAADKQAMAATAKEAMRKWGMNWGKQLRRDSVGSEEAPDAGNVSDGSSTPGTSSLSAQKGRPSYAEVRAKVEERKAGREPSSSPVLIPEGGSPRERTLSTQSGTSASRLGTSPSAQDATLHPPSMGGSVKSEPGLGPSISRSTQNSTSTGGLSGNEADASPPAPAAPIHTQPPQARTMMIPGIHKSHRGEVQSMGYTAPTPAAPSPERPGPAAAVAADARSRVAGVYSRLWKGAAGSPSTSATAGGGTGAGEEHPASDAGESGAQAAPRPSSSHSTQADGDKAPPPPPASPVPPPLPPRKMPSEGATATLYSGGDEDEGSARVGTTSVPELTASGAPPLPPRRTKAPA